MGATIEKENDGVWVLRVSDWLSKEEMDAVQAAALTTPNSLGDEKLLVLVADDFHGWTGSEEWNDMTFFVQHGDKIGKIAVVGDTRWRDMMLMFAAAGLRRAPVKYFSSGQREDARGWLAEP